MRITIVGAGRVGRALATGWRNRGHEVIFGARDPDRTDAALRADGVSANVQATAVAANDATVMVLATPWTAGPGLSDQLGELAGKIIIDCMNPVVPGPDGPALDVGHTQSGGELVQSWFPHARVVKTLNQVGAEMIARAHALVARPAMFLAGDDDDARSTVATLVEDLGFEPLDAGRLHKARLIEPLAMVWINQAMMRGYGRDWALAAIRDLRADTGR